MKSLFRKNKWSVHFQIIVLFFVVLSCTKHVEESYEVIYPLEQDNNSFSVKINRTIPLSNEKEAIIGKVDKLKIYNDRIYILDKRAVSGVLIFSEDGKFLHKTQLGKGPGELVHPQDFNIINDKLVISDQNFIKYYNLDGEYLSTLTLSDSIMGIWSFEPIDKKGLFIHGITKPIIKNGIPIAQPYHVIKDDFSECFESFLETTNDFLILNEESPISVFNGRVLVTSRPSNYLYEYYGDRFYKKYYVDFGSYNFKKEDISKGPMNMISLMESGLRFGLLDELNENESFVSFIYGGSQNKKSVVVPIIYDKKNKVCGQFENIIGRLNFPDLKIHQLRMKNFVCTINPALIDEAQLIKHISQGLVPEGVTTDSNPVVAIVEVSYNADKQ